MRRIVLLPEPHPSGTTFEASDAHVIRSEHEAAVMYREGLPTQWLVPDARWLDVVLRIGGGRRSDQRLLVPAPIDAITTTALHALFTRVVSQPEGGHLLPADELAAVLSDAKPDESFIGGYVHHATAMVVLYRGELSSLVVPLDWFANPHTVRADPDDFEIVDWGHGVRLGEFEAGSDAVLYDFVPVVRAKLAEQDRVNLAEEAALLATRRAKRPLRGEDG